MTVRALKSPEEMRRRARRPVAPYEDVEHARPVQATVFYTRRGEQAGIEIDSLPFPLTTLVTVHYADEWKDSRDYDDGRDGAKIELDEEDRPVLLRIRAKNGEAAYTLERQPDSNYFVGTLVQSAVDIDDLVAALKRDRT